MSIEKDDLVTINEEERQNESSQWMATVYRRTNNPNQPGRATSGLVSPSHVSKMTNESWYYGSVKRKDAETILKRECNLPGSYMIRESETNTDTSHCFSLSVRDHNEVKHYKILNSVDNGASMYYLNPKNKFKTLNELIDYHSKKAEGLCTVLTLPCQ